MRLGTKVSNKIKGYVGKLEVVCCWNKHGVEVHGRCDLAEIFGNRV